MIPRLWSRLEAFFFEPMFATPLALLRIAVGLLTVAWTITLLGDVDPLLYSFRVDPTSEIGWWQFWPSAPLFATVGMVWCLLATAVLLTLGLATRFSAWATFFLTLVVQRYNPFAVNGGDLIMRGVLLMGLALGPAGAYLSIDSRRKQGWKAVLIAPWSLRFIQLHISLGYLLTFYLKLQGQSWVGGTAMWYAFGIGDLARFSLPVWLSAPPIGSIIGWAALLIELGVGLGVWIPRARPWVLLAGAALHLGIALVLEIGFFSYIMIASYLAFVPPVEDARQLLPSLWIRKIDRPNAVTQRA